MNNLDFMYKVTKLHVQSIDSLNPGSIIYVYIFNYFAKERDLFKKDYRFDKREIKISKFSQT